MPRQVVLEADQALKVGSGDLESVFKGGSMLTLSRPEGKIKVGTLASDIELIDSNGQMQLYFAGMELALDERGRVVP